MRKQILALYALAALHFSPVHSAEIQIDNSDPGLPIVSIIGDFEQGDHKIFVAKTLPLDNALVVFRSNGGNLLTGLEIGKAIRLKEFRTLVPPDALCASACALAWLGGSPRFLSQTSSIGFHAAYRNDGGSPIESGMGNAMVGAYLNSLGLPNRAVTYMTVAGPTEMQWLTAKDASTYGIEALVLEDTELPSPQNSPPPQQTSQPRHSPGDERRFWFLIEHEIPNWRQINNDPKFREWLLDIDSATGKTRQSALESGQRDLDAKLVIGMFRAYLALSITPTSPKTAAAPDQQNHLRTYLNICRPNDTQVFADLAVKVEPSVEFMLKRNRKIPIGGISNGVVLRFTQRGLVGTNTFSAVIPYTEKDTYLVVQFANVLTRQPANSELLAASSGWKVYSTSASSYLKLCRSAETHDLLTYSANR